MLIAAVSIGIGSIVLFVLAQSRPLGSRPTMGRRERWTNECSFRADLLTVAAHAKSSRVVKALEPTDSVFLRFTVQH